MISPKHRTSLSAFSLIEVLVALLVLSLVIGGVSKVLLESTACYQKAEQREKLIAVGWSIANSLLADQNEQTLKTKIRYWQERLDVLLPGNVLTIDRENSDDRCFYIIRIFLTTESTKMFELKIVV